MHPYLNSIISLSLDQDYGAWCYIHLLKIKQNVGLKQWSNPIVSMQLMSLMLQHPIVNHAGFTVQ